MYDSLLIWRLIKLFILNSLHSINASVIAFETLTRIKHIFILFKNKAQIIKISKNEMRNV